MKNLTLAILFAVLVISSPVNAGEIFTKDAPTKWTNTDTVLQLATLALFEVDRRQTHWIAKNPVLIKGYGSRNNPDGSVDFTVSVERHAESNAIIGQNAHKDRIDTYFAIVSVGHTAVSYGLRKAGWSIAGVPAVNIWQSIWIAQEISSVHKNFSAGVKMTW